MRKKGERVGAVCSGSESGIRLFGYGIYQGEEIPPTGIKFMGLDLNKLGRKNPKILLDNGKVVWGCECWWGSEEKVKKMAEGKKITIVNPNEHRKEEEDG